MTAAPLTRNEPAAGGKLPVRTTFGTTLSAAAMIYLRRPVVWVLVVVWLLQVAVFAYLINALVFQSNPDDPVMAAVVGNLSGQAAATWPLASMPLYGSPVFILLGALASGSEYRYGTLRVIIPRSGGRVSYVVASWLCVAIVCVITSLLTLVVSWAMSAALSGVTDQEVTAPAFSEMLTAFGLGALIILTMASLGFSLALLTRSILVGLVLGVGWIVGIEILLLSMLAPVAEWIDGLRGVLPAGAAGSAVADIGDDADLVLSSTVGVSDLVDTPVAVAVLAVWLVLCVVVSVAAFRRRDLN